MERTKNRSVAVGSISKPKAMVFGSVLGILGFGLILTTNYYALVTAFTGWFVYVFIYTPLKHRSVHATLVGSIAGATPPVVGYAAVISGFDTAALMLFLILAVWQMPHFYSIAIFRMDEYAKAAIPVLPIRKGVALTKIYISTYVSLFLISAVTMYVVEYSSVIYLVTIVLFGLAWFGLAIKGFKAGASKVWARQMFRFSLVVLMAFSIMISINAV